MSKSPSPLRSLYLGVSFDAQEVIKRLLEQQPNVKLLAESGLEQVTDLLARGEVVACVSGRNEFGARALGNRSILADSRSHSAIRFINDAIKNRDFWMPFALTILSSHADEYIVNPKCIRSSHMTQTFNTIVKNREKIIAGIHPYDFTCRAQILSETENPQFYSLIDSLRQKTGVPAVLNTSYNIHRFPLAGSSDDIISTFLKSGLKFIFINHKFLLEKTSCDK